MDVTWVTVTDENGRDFKAFLDTPNDQTTDVSAWTFFNGENGFGEPSGTCQLVTGLKKLDDGKYGA